MSRVIEEWDGWGDWPCWNYVHPSDPRSTGAVSALRHPKKAMIHHCFLASHHNLLGTWILSFEIFLDPRQPNLIKGYCQESNEVMTSPNGYLLVQRKEV